MKTQIGSRLGLAHVQDVLKQVCERKLSIEQACESLSVGKSRLYTLRYDHLKARTARTANVWRPNVSGGNHAAPWDERVVTVLGSAILKGYSYAFAASEVDRLYGVSLARSQVRQWAIREGVGEGGAFLCDEETGPMARLCLPGDQYRTGGGDPTLSPLGISTR